MPVPFGPENRVSVLAIGQSEDYRKSLVEIFGHSNWDIQFAQSLGEARPFLYVESIAVVLCEYELADGKWVDVLNEIQMSGRYPRLIVAASNADESLWAEVLNLGGYDVLEMPFQTQEVVRVLSLAWLHWRKQPAMQAMAEATVAAAC